MHTDSNLPSLIDGVTFRGEDCTSLARESGGVLDVLAGKRAEGG